MIVEQWSDVTMDALERWWKELGPLARRVRKHSTTDQLYEMLLTGATMGTALGGGRTGAVLENRLGFE